jgi:hypothetical protein
MEEQKSFKKQGNRKPNNNTKNNSKFAVASQVRNILKKELGHKPSYLEVRENSNKPEVNALLTKLTQMIEKNQNTMKSALSRVGLVTVQGLAKKEGDKWSSMTRMQQASLIAEVLSDDLDPSLLVGLAKGAYNYMIQPIYNRYKSRIHQYLNKYPFMHKMLDTFTSEPMYSKSNIVANGNVVSREVRELPTGAVIDNYKQIQMPSAGGYGFDDVWIRYLKCLFDPVTHQTRMPNTDDLTALCANNIGYQFNVNPSGNGGVKLNLGNFVNSTQLGSNTSTTAFMVCSNDSTFNPATGTQSATAVYFQSPLFSAANGNVIVDARPIGIKVKCTPLASGLNNSGLVQAAYFSSEPIPNYVPGGFDSTGGIPSATLQQCATYQSRSAVSGPTTVCYQPCYNDDFQFIPVTQANNDDVVYFLITGASAGAAYEIRVEYCYEYRTIPSNNAILSILPSPAGAGSLVAMQNLFKMHTGLLKATEKEMMECIASMPNSDCVTYQEFLNWLEGTHKYHKFSLPIMAGGSGSGVGSQIKSISEMEFIDS